MMKLDTKVLCFDSNTVLVIGKVNLHGSLLECMIFVQNKLKFSRINKQNDERRQRLATE